MKDPRDIIKRPVITEKSMKAYEEENKVTFEVVRNTNKIEVRHAIEAIFNVKVESVNIVNSKSKKKRVGRYVGTVGAKKKAIVKLAQDSKIELFG